MSNALTQKTSIFPPARRIGLINLLLVALLCWLGAQWTWRFLAPKGAPMGAPAPAVQAERVLETVRSAHLFGEAAPMAGAPDPGVPTSLSLKLSGVFAAHGKLPAVAIIKVENQGDLPFTVDDKVLPGVVLQRVEPDHVLLRRGAVTERLNLEQKALPQGEPKVSARLNVRPEGPGKFGIVKSELDKMLSDPQELAHAGRIKSVPGVGVRIEEAETGSLVQKLGLKKGDVVRRINNRTVEQAADLLQGYRDQLQMGGTIRVQGTRNGQPFEYNYNLN